MFCFVKQKIPQDEWAIDHNNKFNFHAFDTLIMRRELMIIGADSCLHMIIAELQPVSKHKLISE